MSYFVPLTKKYRKFIKYYAFLKTLNIFVEIFHNIVYTNRTKFIDLSNN